MLGDLKTEMKKAAKNLEFERAAQLRDKIKELSRMDIFLG
jgi:excinuclease UvrABC nuclease subunit